jgi:hypothetical protein
MSRPHTMANIRGRSTMGSASDVNRSLAIGHARSPGQSADWPHSAPSMTRADAVSRGSVSVEASRCQRESVSGHASRRVTGHTLRRADGRLGSIVRSHDVPWASSATLVGRTAARAASVDSNRSMCQNRRSLRLPGNGLFSTRLQPISPRRCGEFSMHAGSNCADAVLVMKTSSTTMVRAAV